jgi:GrpB-like predicted nucleotidyltransferase (UPF0157 family)
VSDKLTDEQIAAVTIGERKLLNSTITLVNYDPSWVLRFNQVQADIRQALRDTIVLLEHVGSTSVPGLCAKPIVDIVLEVADSRNESVYVPKLEKAGYALRIREPEWYEHRLLKLSDVNLHVFSVKCEETMQMLQFRDWLRNNPSDRSRYQKEKRKLAARIWKHTQNYADAKSAVIRDIMARSESGKS